MNDEIRPSDATPEPPRTTPSPTGPIPPASPAAPHAGPVPSHHPVAPGSSTAPGAPVQQVSVHTAPAAPPHAPLPPAASSATDTASGPRRPSLGAVVAVSLITAFIVAAFAGALAGFAGASLVMNRTSGLFTSGGTIRVSGETSEPVAAAAAVALPSVVNIDISGAATSSANGLPQGHPNVPVSGNGSGVAYKRAPDNGTYIITNNHVIAGADSIVVTPVNGDQAKATLVGTDPETDIAVVRVDTALPLISVADSKKVAVGDMTIAIGSPYGLEHSVSSGVVSAMHRSLPPDSLDASDTSSLVDVIQTDAAINPGNSGGALIDRFGKLVGIPSAIFSESGSNDGIGFAIPVNVAARVADELISSGKVKHPFLGISGQTVTETFAKSHKLPANQGALIVEVFKGSAAEKAGLKKDDLVVALDDARIRSMEELVAAVREAGVGTSVTLRLYRGGAQQTVTMVVGVKPANL